MKSDCEGANTYRGCHSDVGCSRIRFFLMYLKYIGLLRSKMQCNTCGRDMAWSADSSKLDGYRWRCRKRVARVVCNQSASIRLGSWFQQRLDLVLFFLITPFHSFFVLIHSYCTLHPYPKVRLGVIFFNNLLPLAPFHSFFVLIHSYYTHHP